MRTMEGGRNPDFLSTGGGLGRHSRHNAATRTLSPSCDTYGGGMPPRQRQRQRPPQGDSSTEEIIRFVRGYQLEREPTLMRLQKKAPLPGIGQVNHSFENSSYTSPHRDRHNGHMDEDEDEGGDDYEDSLLDSEVAAIDAGRRDPLRQLGVFEDFRFASVRAEPGKRHDRYPMPNASYGPPASYQRHPIRPLDNHGHVGARAHARRNLGRSLNQLPPIARDELPERPSAPSPSLTPPGEGEELDSAGEPVDFIDAS